MPVKRQYRVKGTKDFLVLAGIFFFLCLWAIKDAWFPSPDVVKKHPLEIPAVFESSGTVETVHVEVGDSIVENQMMAKLRSDRIAVEYEESKKAYTAARKAHARLRQDENSGEAALASARQAMAVALAKVEELRTALDATGLKSPGKGMVKEARVAMHSMVEAGDVAFVIDPKDHFYTFNKSLAIVSFFLFWVFLAIHFLGH